MDIDAVRFYETGIPCLIQQRKRMIRPGHLDVDGSNVMSEIRVDLISNLDGTVVSTGYHDLHVRQHHITGAVELHAGDSTGAAISNIRAPHLRNKIWVSGGV